MKRRSLPRKLTSSELAKTVRLLKRVTPLPFMEAPVFKTFWKARLMPMVTLELFIFESDPFAPSAKTLPRVLLSYREDDYYDGWHLPGGYLGANETSTRTVQRIARRELGADPQTIQHVFTFNRPNEIRDHHYSGFFAVMLAKAPRLKRESLEYFDPSRLPPKLIPCHREALAFLKKIYSFSRTLPKDQQRKFLEILDICEISGKV